MIPETDDSELLKAAFHVALEDDWDYWWGYALALRIGSNEQAVFSRTTTMSAVKWYVRRNRPAKTNWELYVEATEGAVITPVGPVAVRWSVNLLGHETFLM
jgi:hypothetical protein